MKSQKLTSIVFIDSQVENYQSLIIGIPSTVPIVVLNCATDGIDKITQTLQTANYQEVHLISHGAPGCLYLGNSQLSLDTLEQYQTHLRSWFGHDNTLNNSLGDRPPRILVYGCNVAAEDAGREFIAQLKHLTSAEIAATANLTGNKLLGGDWNLEVTTADNLDIHLAIDETTKLSYSGVFGTFNVTVADDEDDGDYSDENLSLREAIALANETEGADEIHFDNNLDDDTIQLNLGQISITDDLTIQGLGADNLTIDAGGNSGIFAVSLPDVDTEVYVTIDGLSLTGGNATEGGAIFNNGDLTVSNSRITGNTAEAGGGIYTRGINPDIDSGILTVINTEITNNSADYGGGIDASLLSTVDITGSTISDNQAEVDGGGISAIGDGFNTTESTISGNSARRNGGGFYSAGFRSGSTFTNSTISNNSAVNYGGGIFTVNSPASINNSTISGNSAGIDGGGIYDDYDETTFASSIWLSSTIVAGNTISQDDSSPDGADIGGGDLDPDNSNGYNSNGNNLIGNGDGAIGFTDGINGDIVGTTDNPIDPRLGTLQDNGGNTFTQALLEGSPAIDAGSNPNNLVTDQRGEGFDRTVGDGTDIGAYELQDSSSDPDLFVRGTAGNDILIGGTGDDTLEGLDGNDFLLASDGNDLNNGGRGRDTIRGGLGDDTIFGNFGRDLLLGEAGNDNILGNEAADTLEGGSGDDTLRGGGNLDLLDGGDGDDLLYGDFARDTLLGGAGKDTLYGASGDDFLEGGEGDDLLYGGQGFDLLSGNEGTDIFVLESLRGIDSIVDFVDGIDRLGLSDGLIFDNLSFSQDGANTSIHDLTDNNNTLAVLFNVDAADLSVEDFIVI